MWHALPKQQYMGNSHHIGLRDEDMDISTMITTYMYNTAVTDAASEILGNKCRRKMPWVTRDVLDLFDERR